MPTNATLHIIVDRREQAPFAFSESTTIARATIPAGDYSLAGYTDRVSVERKSHADAWGSVFTVAARKRIARVLDELGRLNKAGGLGIVAISCTRDQLVMSPDPARLAERHGRRIRRTWEELCAARSVPIIWGAGAEEVEGALRGWLEAQV